MKQHPESHMDHGFTKAQWDYIFAKYSDKTAFFIDTFELPEDLGTVTNELYGPSAGDSPVAETDVFYGKRGERAWDSRLTMLPKRPTRFVRVIAGPHEEKCDPAHHWPKQCILCEGEGVIKHACILYTAYGVASLDMPAAPKEVGDLETQLLALEGVMPYDAAKAQHQFTQEDLEKIARCKAQLSEARIFWATHALAAPLTMMPCPDCGTPNMGDAVYDPTVPDTDGRCQTCGML